MNNNVDVAIAGAGIAGCLLARNLARDGHRVAVIEKSKREDAGHDWWDTIKIAAFARVGMPEPEPPELMSTRHEATVYLPLETKPLTAPPRPESIHVDRKLLEQRQIRYAEEAGAELLFGAKATGPLLDGDRVAGMGVETADGQKIELRAKITIDAAGMSGALRSKMPEKFGFPRQVERKDMFVTYREIRNNTTDSRDDLLIFGKNNGVVWVNRAEAGMVDFFAGAINFPGRPEPRDIVNEMIRKTPEAGDRIMRGGYGAPIPVRHCFDSFVAPGFMLCGDSACHCSPIDGSGMASSMIAADHASKVAHAALENGDTSVAALWPYIGAYKREQGVPFVGLDAVQKFMVSEPKINLELLFTRGVLKIEEFWGSGGGAGGNKLKMLLRLIKLADRPLFVRRLIASVGIGAKLKEHYMNFPEKYDPAEFAAWVNEKQRLFAELPPAMLPPR